MAGETTLTIVGNLTADPTLRFTQDGTSVANFNVASTPRTFDRAAGEWRDGDTLFLRCNVWREMADNAFHSLTRGMRVVVQGRMRQRSFDTREGERRTVFELEVDEVGPSLRYARAEVTKNQPRNAVPEKRATPVPQPEAAAEPGSADEVPWVSVDETELVGAAAGAAEEFPGF
ncbi:single-stranded DNA-binding protein [Sciscionella marina]|uniref:single-stranded DNA-binding protein n=1 Tax=Sciscionella marina TaxID=508770 RepID=UPI00036DE851|nr:single-stranded DNA-binding protein [Sciscionella marina]